MVPADLRYTKDHEWVRASDDPQVSRLRWHRSKGVGLDITGVLMREEVTRIRQADAWVFVLRETGGGSKRRGLPRSDPQRTRLVRAHRAGRNDLAARMPETDFLRTKKATIIGLGCVGATVAVELSKATCGTLALVDSDVAEAGQVAAAAWAQHRRQAGHVPGAVLVVEDVEHAAIDDRVDGQAQVR